MCVHALSVTKLCPTLWPQRLWPTRLFCPWDSPDKKLEWVAMIYSRGSSWARDGNCISSIKVRFFTTEPPGKPTLISINKLKNIYHIHLIYKCLYLLYSTNKPRLTQRILHLGSCHENLYVWMNISLMQKLKSWKMRQ